MEKPVEFNTLSIDELQEEYLILFEKFKHLRDVSDEDAQRIHELRRNLDTATAAESYLAQELEMLTAATSSGTQQTQSKLQLELDELRRKHNALMVEHTAAQQDCEAEQQENAQLRERLTALERQQSSVATAEPKISEQQLEREQQLQEENLELMQKLEQFQETNMRHTMAIAEREKNIEILRDQVHCVEENLRSKRDELEEVTQLLESTQEQLLEANAKIAMLTAAPGNNDRKGNSLFAEVDDQRQAMKQLLAAQKKSYMQMKKFFNESEHEIRRLKRENSAMHTELQACSSIFYNAEKTYQDKLNERIRHLLNQNEDLTKNLSWTQQRLKELARDKGVVWLDSMLNFCKQETDNLKKQLHSLRIQKATLEEQIRNSQQEMARWRFESLKSRCVLMDRENLLTENKIAFKPNNTIEFDIDETQLQSARPRIVSAAMDNNALIQVAKVERDISSNNCQAQQPTNAIEIEEQPLKERTNLTQQAATNDETNTVKPIKPSDDFKTDECKENIAAVKHSPLKNTKTDITPLKKTSPTRTTATISVKDFSKLQISPSDSQQKQHQSILCKTQHLFGTDSTKSVQFNDCIKYVEPSNVKECATPIVKQVRAKSNVIVRRVVVKSKHES